VQLKTAAVVGYDGTEGVTPRDSRQDAGATALWENFRQDAGAKVLGNRDAETSL
jgi:hypothetical protein